MAATSPYQNNDYQAMSTFRPYQLPINDIFKAYVAQDQFWKEGAARVKSVYESALNLKLSLEPNRQIRDNFMKEAEKQITKLSSMDLSQGDVQRQGFDIFKPLFQDEGIVSDDAATRHIEKVNNDAMTFRTKDNGKFYSQVNHQYALDGAAEFQNSTDRMAGKSYLQKRKEYEPFYDYTADYEKILKNCPSSTTKGDSVLSDSGYINTRNIKERSVEKVRTCLEAGLSPKAYRQMQIEGYVNYKGRPEVLRDDYMEMLGSGAQVTKSQIEKLSGEVEGITNNKNLKPDEKRAIVENYTQQIEALENELLNSRVTMDKLNKGDMSPIQGNEEAISGSLYQFRKILKESYAGAFQDYENTFKADPVALQKFKFLQDVQLRNIDFGHDALLSDLDYRHDLSIKQIEAQNAIDLQMMKNLADGTKGSTGSAIIPDGYGGYTVNPNIMSVPAHFSDKPTENTKAFENINTQLSTVNQRIKDNDDYLFNTLKERGDADPAFADRLVKAFGVRSWQDWKANGNKVNRDGKTVPYSQSYWFENYVKQNPNDPDIQMWNSTNAQAKIAAQALSQQIEQGEAEVGIKLGTTPSAAARKEISSLKPVSVNGVTITPQDIQDAIEGKQSKVSIETRTTSYEGNRGQERTEDTTVVKINGTEVPSLKNLYNQVASKNKEVNSKLNKARQDVYGSMQFQSEPWFYNIDEKSAPVEILKGLLPDEDGKERKIQIEQLDFSGGFKVRIPGLTDKEFEKLQKAAPFGKDFARRENDDDKDVITVRGANYNVLPGQQSPVMKQSAYVLSVISKGREFQSARPGEKIKSGDLEFPMYSRDGSLQKLSIQTFKDVDNSPVYKIINKTDNKILNTSKDPFAAMKFLQVIQQSQ